MKRRRIKILLFIIIGWSNLLSQDSCIYQNYWYYVRAAAIDYSNKDYAGASKNYKKAFGYNLFNWGNDLHLALKTAIELNDTTWSENLAIELAKGGIPLDYFDQYKDNTWYINLKQNFARYQTHFKENFNQTLRGKLFELGKQDSISNAKFHAFRTGKIEMTLNEMIKNASQIRDGFVNLIKEYGFPSQQNVGYYYDGKNIYRLPVMIILHHTYQRGDLLLKKELSKIICDGKLRPIDQTLLNGLKGWGNSTGIEDEMEIRYKRIMNSKK